MDIPYNKMQEEELSESCQEIDAGHILNATGRSVGREQIKQNWKLIFTVFRKKKDYTLLQKPQCF